MATNSNAVYNPSDGRRWRGRRGQHPACEGDLHRRVMGTDKKLLMLSYHTCAGRRLPKTKMTLLYSVAILRICPRPSTVSPKTCPSWKGDRHLCGYRCERLATSLPTRSAGGPFAIDMRTGLVTVDGGLNFDARTPAQSTPSPSRWFDPNNAVPLIHTSLVVTATDVNEAPTVARRCKRLLPSRRLTALRRTPTTYDDLWVLRRLPSPCSRSGRRPTRPTTSSLELGGDDGSLFDISDEGVVTFKKDPPNLEDPKDANQDNKYVRST